MVKNVISKRKTHIGKCYELKSLKSDNRTTLVFVVATTRHSRTNDLTTSKALSRAIK